MHDPVTLPDLNINTQAVCSTTKVTLCNANQHALREKSLGARAVDVSKSLCDILVDPKEVIKDGWRTVTRSLSVESNTAVEHQDFLPEARIWR